jgi:hypothetical protein
VEPKTYTLQALADMCGGSEAGIKNTLPWHDLRHDGLWLASADQGLPAGDLATMRWHPRRNSGLPALPALFTAHDLAAFMLAGGGLYLFEQFDFEPLDASAMSMAGPDGDGVTLSEHYRDELTRAAAQASADFEEALRDLGDNADEAREALRHALKLRRMACLKFGREDEGARDAAAWLLSSADDLPADDSATSAPDAATAGATIPNSRAKAQEAAILKCLRDTGHDPLQLPPEPQGKPGVKAAARAALGNKGMWAGTTVFEKAWERLLRNGRIVRRQ